GLSCAGFGSTVCVTATFGFIAAGEVLRHLASRGTASG
ncbi:MAG TPA: tRNA threonylcarbamoyladenosine dehydratase, partial [Accumulibacter sp.]|nr:tRNA threonylcarbamoyladenosine dehydratase [Accumulibacter sp.]